MSNIVLDIRTVFIILSVISFLLAGALILFSFINNHVFKGIIHIGIALLMVTGSYLLNGFQDKIPKEFSLVFSLSSFGIAFFLIFYGYSLFLKIAPKILYDILFLSFYISSITYFTINSNFGWRISLSSLMVLFYSLRIAYLSIFRTPNFGKIAYRIFGAAFSFFGIAFFSRVFLFFASDSHEATSYLSSGNSQAYFLVLVIIFTIVLSVYFIFLINLEILYMKDRFISILSHEVKNKFSAMLGLSELLLTSETKNRNEIYQHLFTASREGYDNLNNLLEWTKNRFGLYKISKEKFNLISICNTIISDYSAPANMKNILVSFNYTDKIIVNSDKTLNELIIRNLLSNAIKYTPKNGIIIIDLLAEKSKCHVSVKDSGKGMEPSVVSSILQNKSLGSVSGTNKERGTGVGLLLSKSFIELLGGKLSIRSNINEGTDIGYSLPI